MRVFWGNSPILHDRWYRKVDHQELDFIRLKQKRGEQYKPVSNDGPYPHPIEFVAGKYFSKPMEGGYLIQPSGGVISVAMNEAPDMGEQNTGIRRIIPYSNYDDEAAGDLPNGCWGSLNKAGIPSSIIHIEVVFPDNIRSGTSWTPTEAEDIEMFKIG